MKTEELGQNGKPYAELSLEPRPVKDKPPTRGRTPKYLGTEGEIKRPKETLMAQNLPAGGEVRRESTNRDLF